MSKHILICPAVKRRQDLAGKEYFREGINLGGFGSMGSAASSDGGSESGGTVAESEEAKRLAYAVLRVFHRLFLSGGDNGASKHCLALTDRQLQSISESDIYDALPENDLSWVEE
jgi:superfamily I DNA/RNA helicase